MKTSGVYQIQSKIHPERIYIGSSVDIKNRWNSHLNFMLRGYAPLILQAHYNKYGVEDFVFTIVELCFPEYLKEREKYYIEKLKPYFNCRKTDGKKLHQTIDESDYKGYWSWWATWK